MSFEVGKTYDFYGVDNSFFKLDDVVYEAVEDESDGYRSMMEDIRENCNPDGLVFFRGPIARVRVKKVNERFEGYSLIDVTDSHEWLRMGTDDPDDYYPSYIFNYSPKGEK